jgi:hypothetical protein
LWIFSKKKFCEGIGDYFKVYNEWASYSFMGKALEKNVSIRGVGNSFVGSHTTPT